MYSACILTVTGSWLWVEWKSFWTTGALLEFSSCRHTIKQSLYSTRTKLLVVICAEWPDRCQDSDTFVLPRTFQLATHHVSRVGGIKCLIWGRGLVLWWTTAQKHTIHTFNDSQKHETRCMAFHLMESFANNKKKKKKKEQTLIEISNSELKWNSVTHRDTYSPSTLALRLRYRAMTVPMMAMSIMTPMMAPMMIPVVGPLSGRLVSGKILLICQIRLDQTTDGMNALFLSIMPPSNSCTRDWDCSPPNQICTFSQ